MPGSATLVTPTERVPTGDILDRIGDTPLLRVRRLDATLDNVEIHAKAEWFNPGGSVKDRAALRIIEDAERRGDLTHDKVLLDSTSGNTGIAYAMIGAIKGYRVELLMPENVSEERKKILAGYGATITYTDPYEGSDGSIREARRLYAAHPERYYYADQYGNASNWRAHYDGTGREIWRQTAGKVTHFVASLGTSGTIMGVGRRLKEYRPDIRIIGVEPDSAFHGIEGLKHMETAIVPAIYDKRLLDHTLTVSTEDAFAMARRLAAEEGLFVGQSAGAAMCAALRLAGRVRDGLIVVLFPDGGDRYLSTSLWTPRATASHDTTSPSQRNGALAVER